MRKDLQTMVDGNEQMLMIIGYDDNKGDGYIMIMTVMIMTAKILLAMVI